MVRVLVGSSGTIVTRTPVITSPVSATRFVGEPGPRVDGSAAVVVVGRHVCRGVSSGHKEQAGKSLQHFWGVSRCVEQ
jgi:hypothetical protein